MPSASTIGEAHDWGWSLTVSCAQGKQIGMKRIPECVSRHDIDLATLVWTRGRDFPLDLLEAG